MSQVVGYECGVFPAGPEVEAAAENSGAPYEIRLLGPLTVLRAGYPVAMPLKQRALLGLLAVQPDQTVSHEEIADVLWSGEAPSAYPKLVHTYVARLRRIIEPPAVRSGRTVRRISTVRGGYVFKSSGAGLDLGQFEERCGRARQLTSCDPLAALELFGQALRGWQGRLLQDLPQLWQHPSVVRVAQRHIDVAIEFADLALRLNRPGCAVEKLRVASYEEPLHEALQARIMMALAGSGRRAAALRLFTDLRMRLKKELGVEPSDELWQARYTILLQDGQEQPVEPAGPSPRTSPSNHSRGVFGTAFDGVPPRTRPTPLTRPASISLPAQLPSVVTPFVGREQQLSALDGLLRHQRGDLASVGIATVHGGPDIGKTALAVRWAHSRNENFPDGQLYADLQGSPDHAARPLHPRTVLTRFLRALGVADEWIPDSVEEASGLFRSQLAGRRFLVVLDDAADSAQVRGLLPGTPGNLVLVTSRSPLMDLVAREGALPVALDVLSAPEAYALIEAFLGPDRTAAEPQAVAELAAACGQYPLRLRGAVARLAAAPHLPVHTLVADLARGNNDSLVTLRQKRPSTPDGRGKLERSVGGG